ncbi:MAG: hypothetical protein IJT72_05020 [Lachnospiraceae bacterium]|nr:hypothetical protein [Lachnospiraceae bacterium]
MRKKLITLIVLCSIIFINLFGNTVSATELDADFIDYEPETEELSDDESLTYDINSPTVHAWELSNQTIQNTLTGPDTTYWRASNTFLSASDIYGQTVTAYCLQPKKASPNANINLVEGNSVLSPDGLQAAACAIAAFGYGGECTDPNIEIFGGSRNSLAGGSYASYVIDGQLKRGLMINGILYELTPEEAQAVTGASVHYFSALAGQGDNVDAPTGSKINIYHNDYVKNAFDNLTFIGLHFMNQYKTMAGTALSVENGSDWEKALDDYHAEFSWQIKTKDGSFIDYNPQTDNVLSDENYLINANGTNYIIFKLNFSASKCSLKLIDHDHATSMSGSATIIPNDHKIYVNPSDQRCYDYFYVSASKPCTVEYGPLYNGTYYQVGPGTTLSLPTFNQDVIITIPEESIRNGISINADTLTGFSATPVYGDGDHDGEYNYSCRLFSDTNPDRDYQDILLFSPGNTFTRHTEANISGSFNYYGYLELFKSSANDKITKENSNYSLENAVYALYKNNQNAVSDKNRISTLTTNKDGYAKSEKLEAGTYYLKEISAPKGYVLDKKIYTAVIEKGNSTVETTQNKLYLNETPLTNPVDILLYKTDENGNPLGNAEFTVKYYTVLSDTNPADKGYMPVKTWVFKTDTNSGYAHFNDMDKISGDDFYYDENNVVLPIGTVTIEETKAPESYEKNNHIDVQKIYPDNNTSKILRFNPPEISDKKIKQSIEFNKLGEIKADTYITLEGAGFMACRVSELEKNETGEYIWDNEKAIPLTDDGKKEIFTDENGYAKTIPLEYGTYIFRETTVPINFLPVDDIIVSITSSTPEVKTLETLHDKGFNLYLHIDKICSYSKERIINNPAEFSIWSYDDGAYLTFDNSEILSTDENGELTTPSPLFPGKYRLDEIKAPEGYNIPDKNGIDFSIDENDIIEIIPYDNSCGIMTMTVENQSLQGEIKISKQGEYMTYNKDSLLFTQDTKPLPDVVFGIYAYEDIYTSDGHNTVIYKKGDKIAEVTTDSEGNTKTPMMPYGKYIIKELKTPENYIPSGDIIVTVDKSTQVKNIKNNLSKTKLTLIKKSEEENIPLANAAYAIYEYNSDFITADEYRNTTGIEEQITDSEGTISFNTLLPPGKYVIIETKAPEGYYISDEIEIINTYASPEETSLLSADLSEKLSMVSSAYTISDEGTENGISTTHFDEFDLYTLSVTDKKIPKTPDKPKAPKTGDKVLTVLFIMFLTGAILAFNFIKAARKDKD